MQTVALTEAAFAVLRLHVEPDNIRIGVTNREARRELARAALMEAIHAFALAGGADLQTSTLTTTITSGSLAHSGGPPHFRAPRERVGSCIEDPLLLHGPPGS